MSRVKITEHTAKRLLYKKLGLTYNGVSLTSDKTESSLISHLSTDKTYVLKVDQGVKKRMKRGLVALNKTPQEIVEEWERLISLGYSRFIIEEFLPHESNTERFLSFERTREGIVLHYSLQGGIDVEEHADELQKTIFNDVSVPEVSRVLSLSSNVLQAIYEYFEEYFVSFLEINPLVVSGETFHILDMAVEVDSTAEFFVQGGWRESDIVYGLPKQKTPEEIAIQELSAKSQAAFSLELLNPDGSVFVLLSGGGASLVVADEVYNLGYGKELANYGEYSGNPNADETYEYTKQLLSLLLKSKSPKRVLLIGGGVANFTDVRITFRGVLKALQEVKTELVKVGVKVFVRRGGPHQEEGLAMMETFLEKEGLYGDVSGPEIPLNEMVQKGIQFIAQK